MRDRSSPWPPAAMTCRARSVILEAADVRAASVRCARALRALRVRHGQAVTRAQRDVDAAL